MAQDEFAPSTGGSTDAAYTVHEEQALSLAAELRTRVQRERATVARLQAYLTGKGRSPEK